MLSKEHLRVFDGIHLANENQLYGSWKATQQKHRSKTRGYLTKRGHSSLHNQSCQVANQTRHTVFGVADNRPLVNEYIIPGHISRPKHVATVIPWVVESGMRKLPLGDELKFKSYRWFLLTIKFLISCCCKCVINYCGIFAHFIFITIHSPHTLCRYVVNHYEDRSHSCYYFWASPRRRSHCYLDARS